MKKKMALFMTLLLAFSTAACGKSGTEGASEQAGGQTSETVQEEESKILQVAANFSHPSLDAHVGYQGWYTSFYGMTETLFKLNENSEVQPWLAEDAAVEGNTWTVTLKEGISFSNGNPVTADTVIENLRRAAEKNERFSYISEFEMTAVDARTFTITSEEFYPTMKNELASPELGIMDLEGTEDFESAPICTGPFVVTEFVPENTVTVAANENYWDGEVQLDGAVFHYMPDDDSKLMAMQSGELDCYDSVTAAALEIYEADPESYQVVTVPASRLQFYILNENTLSDQVRAAVNMTVDPVSIASYLGGTVTAAQGPFSPDTAYGKVTKPAVDTEKAKELLEEDGYRQNGEGYYEKDGVVLDLNIAYYASRSLDTIAALIQEELQAIGIKSHLTCEEDPDGTYIATGDFDLALYCMIADKAGDPYYFLDSTLREGAYFDVGGFDSEEAEALLDQLKYEQDTAKRAELANQIVQISIDDNAFGYVGLFNRITVLRPGVGGFNENKPFDFYGIDAGTWKE